MQKTIKRREYKEGYAFHVNPDVDFMVENEIVIIKTIKLRVCEEDYGWNPRICVCGCDKDFEIGKYLED